MAESRPASVLLIGEGPLADATARALEAGAASVVRLPSPDDREIRAALGESPDRVVVISRYDHVSLRQALVVSHVSPGTPSLVTVFDRDVARHVQANVHDVTVLSMADVVAPAFAGPCLDSQLLSVIRKGGAAYGVRAVDGVPRRIDPTWSTPSRARRVVDGLESLARPFDSSARILVAGLVALLVVLVLETAVTMVAGDLGFVDAFYTVAKVAVTVGPSAAADDGPVWFKLFSAVMMLLTLGFAALLTAGLVNRLVSPRLTGIVGRTAVPRRDHVVVVGLGQVGLRLALMLRRLGVPVIVLEQNAEAKNVARAKDYGLPVVIGSGSSVQTLRRLSMRHARALAAVTSDEVENIAIAVAARSLRDDLHIALRAGDGDATSETQSLFGIGVVRDVYRIAGTALAARALGFDVDEGFPYEETLYFVDAAGEIWPFVPSGG